MRAQRQDSPVTKMSIQGNEDAIVNDGEGENIRVIGPTQSDFAGPYDVMAQPLQLLGQFYSEHLVNKEAHGGLDRNQFSNFRVDHAGLRKSQGSLDVGADQLRVAIKQSVPRFTLGKLAKDDFHRYARAFDYGPTSTNTRINFNAIVHALNVASIHNHAKRTFFCRAHFSRQEIAIAPTDKLGVGGQVLNSLLKAMIEIHAFVQKQLRHLIKHGFQAVVKGLVDVTKLPCELGAFFHVG